MSKDLEVREGTLQIAGEEFQARGVAHRLTLRKDLPGGRKLLKKGERYEMGRSVGRRERS